MGVEQPYLYDAPARYSALDPYNGFDPKPVSRASLLPPPPPKPKQDRPLLDFNRHPDSYLILPYGQTDAKPMDPRTKNQIKYVRWVQLSFRVLQLIGAIGMLICVICIQGTQDTEGWVLRIPAGVDILTTCYAIYHLIRPAKGRTPTSSASYHFFAFFMDAGLIPFYVFAAMMANSNYTEQFGTDGRWRTFFQAAAATDKLLLATWVISMTDAGLHFISLTMDLYLVVMFRKIARLPPDMNPLEDNLTSRHASKHKYKNSNATVSITEKRLSDLTGSRVSLASPSRMSQAQDPLIPDSRAMSFFDTRAESHNPYSPHNPAAAHLSRTNLPDQFYQQSHSVRSSRSAIDLHRGENNRTPGGQSQRSLFLDPSSARLAAQSSRARSPASASRSHSPASASASASAPASRSRSPASPSRSSSRAPTQRNNATAAPTAQATTHTHLARHPTVSSSVYSTSDTDSALDADVDAKRASLVSDNWFVNAHSDSDAPSSADEAYPPAGASVKSNKKRGGRAYQPVPRHSMEAELLPSPQRQHQHQHQHRQEQPLKMDPPTPPPVPDAGAAGPGLGRAPTTASVKSTRSTRSTASRASTKRRYYGDLAAATRGIRQQQQERELGPELELGLEREQDREREPGQRTRVVSRSGVDVDDFGGAYAAAGDLGLGRRREVSGKVVEEGRGGVEQGLGGWGRGIGGLVQRKVSGVA